AGVHQGYSHNSESGCAVMLGVTGLQVLCAIGAVYLGSLTGAGFGRDLRSAMFEHIITFSER
ncbi:ABC transporter ATP-binding protein, partial [Mycobacterium tuberculosis]